MFYVYALFLIFSGIAMLVMAFVRAGYAKRRQVVNFIFGAGFLIYGLYLLLAFNGGTYLMFYYAFVVPILLVVQFFRDRAAFKSRQTATGPAGNFPPAGSFPEDGAPWMHGPSAGNGQPAGYGQAPGNGQGGYGQPAGYGQPPGNGQGGYGQGAGQQGGYQNGRDGW